MLASTTWCQSPKNDACKGELHLLAHQWDWESRSGSNCPWRTEENYFDALVAFVDWDKDGRVDVLQLRPPWQENSTKLGKKIAGGSGGAETAMFHPSLLGGW